MQAAAPTSSVHAHARGFAHPGRNVDALGIEPGMLIADFGAGSGAYALHIAEELQGLGRVYAVDVQRDLLQRLHNEAKRRKLSVLEVIWADLEQPGASKLADHKVDRVLVSNLLFQLEDRRAVLDEAWRILRPAGRLAVIDWAGMPPASGSRFGPQKHRAVSKEAAIQLVRESGFALEREFAAGAHHYGLLFRPVARQRV